MAASTAQKRDSSERTSLMFPHSTHDNDRDSHQGGPSSNYGTVNDAEAALPTDRSEEQRQSSSLVTKVVGALFIGVFTSNLDGSLTLATHPVIASEFQDLEDSSWLFISFWLAASCTQSIYGKLSDLYGRKPILLVSYGLFALGCAIVGIGQTMWQVLVGRVVSGFGQAGMMVLAAVVITDLVPIREVATWQGYMNVIAVAGRTLGGPLGGWLADVVGWRWSFLGQVPVFLAAIVICWVIFRSLEGKEPNTSPNPASSAASNLARIDFLGAITLGLGLLSLMLPLEIGGQKVAWSHPIIFALVAMGLSMLGLFIAAETRWAKEPIFPLRLLKSRDALLCYCITGCILAAQSGMTFTVPLYFQVTQRSSSTAVGARLFPAVAGNAVGGIVSGYLIRRTGRYKILAIIGTITSTTSYLLMMLLWNGQTSWAESLYIFPGGLGCGIIQSTIFIAVQATIDPKDKATAISGFFLATQIGMVLGMAAVSALMIAGVQQTLRPRLIAEGVSMLKIDKIVKRAVTDVNYLGQVPVSISKAIVASYINGLKYSHAFSVISSIIAFCAVLLLREKGLDN